MSRINPVQRNANPETKELFGVVEKRLGKVPNLVATLAQSPAVARAYLETAQSLSSGLLSESLRERIALTVSEANQCDYCLSAHCYLGKKAGLRESELQDARHGTSVDDRVHAALTFARKIVEDRGHVSDEDVEEVRHAGYTEGEIVEIVANVALTNFTNYFNHVAETEVDFPRVQSLATV